MNKQQMLIDVIFILFYFLINENETVAEVYIDKTEILHI